jgi:hypothetical protein
VISQESGSAAQFGVRLGPSQILKAHFQADRRQLHH